MKTTFLLLVALLLSGCAHHANTVKQELSVNIKQGNDYSVGPVVETTYKVAF
jgi:hypothetical protein